MLALFLPGSLAQGVFFEGDILVKEEVSSNRNPEMVLQDPSLRWPRGVVPFAFCTLSKFTSDEKHVVRRSMERVKEKTGCIDFIESDIARGGDIVLITSLGYGNHSGNG